MTQKRFSGSIIKIIKDLDKIEIPQYLTEFCSDSHEELKENLTKSNEGLFIADFSAMEFIKQLKSIAEVIETNLKLVKSLKNSEAKKYSKEVESMQQKFSKLIDFGKKVLNSQSEIDTLSKDLMMSKKLTPGTTPKKRTADQKTIKEKLASINILKDKLELEFEKLKQETSGMANEYNESKKLIFRTFNAHTDSIDSRIKDNLMFYQKKLNEFSATMRFGIEPSKKKEKIIVELRKPSVEIREQTNSLEKTEELLSVENLQETRRPKRLVGFI